MLDLVTSLGEDDDEKKEFEKSTTCEMFDKLSFLPEGFSTRQNSRLMPTRSAKLSVLFCKGVSFAGRRKWFWCLNREL